MKDNRLWCYGLSEKGKFYGNEVYPIEEKWEAVEKGEELAKYEDLEAFYIGRVSKSNNVENIEKIEVEALNKQSRRLDVSRLNELADELGFYSSKKSTYFPKK